MRSSPPPGAVLIVEEDGRDLELLKQILSDEGYDVRCAVGGSAALSALDHVRPDVIVLDVGPSNREGFELCREIKHSPSTRLTPVMMVSGHEARDFRIEGLDAGVDDFIVRPFDAAELNARIRSLIRLKRYTDELESAEAVILSLALTVEARDSYTEGHCHRLATYSTVIGEAIGLGAEDLAALARGAYLHDVGKIGIPDAILLKPGLLTASEFEIIKQHPVIGERLCGDLRSLARVRPIVRHHHERLDGTGYPDGLEGDQVPLSAQIVSIADAYDAITTTRPYRAASPPVRAFAELRRDAERGARNPELVETFIALGREGRLDRNFELRT